MEGSRRGRESRGEERRGGRLGEVVVVKEASTEVACSRFPGTLCTQGPQIRPLFSGRLARRLVIYPDNCTYFSVIGRISVQGEGVWRCRLQTRTRVQVHQWAANYFLVRMMVPGTKPVENPCYRWIISLNGTEWSVYLMQFFRWGQSFSRYIKNYGFLAIFR